MKKLQALKARAAGLYHNTNARIAVALVPLTASTGAYAQGSSWDAFFDEVDFSGVSAKVIAGGLLIIGIAIAFKGPDLAKRLVRKA